MENLKRFDKIVMADVVEHIEQGILDKIFEKISHSLKELGVLVIHTMPNREYYDKTYPQIRKRAASVGYYMPKNPRSYYEQLMHINEQTPQGLQTVLEKYFPYVKVWTGSVTEIDADKAIAESREDIQIFAYACNDRKVLDNLIGEITINSGIPQPDMCKVNIEADDFMIISDRESYLDIDLQNMGDELITSRRKHPIHIAYHIMTMDGEMLVYEGERTKITEFIHAGEKQHMKMKLIVPEELASDKQYLLRITCVAEGNFWFDMNNGNMKDAVIVVK